MPFRNDKPYLIFVSAFAPDRYAIVLNGAIVAMSKSYGDADVCAAQIENQQLHHVM